MRRALAHRGDWSIWVRDWFCHHIDRYADRRIRSGRAGWFTEDWILRQHRRRFGLAAFIRSDYGLEPPPDPAPFLDAATGPTADDHHTDDQPALA